MLRIFHEEAGSYKHIDAKEEEFEIRKLGRV